MKLRLSWSPAAEEDLLQIWRYIADQAFAPRADEQIRKIRNAGQTLRDWPFSGRSREELMPGRAIGRRRRMFFSIELCRTRWKWSESSTVIAI